MPQTSKSEILTTFQAAKLCGVSHKSIERWIDSGVLAGFRTPGGHRRLYRSDLLKLVADRRTAGPNSESSPASRRASVLLVGDAAVSGSGLRDHLAAFGHFKVSAASSCFEAGVMIERLRPRVIVLDVSTDCRDGEAVWNLLRTDATHADVVVIALTDSSDVARVSDESGRFHATFVSPVNPSAVRLKLQSLVENAGFVRDVLADT